METLIELKPNRSLLDPDFDSYRFNAKLLQIVEKKLQKDVTQPELSPEQYGLCHAQLHAKRSLLVTDDFNPELAFYTSQGQIYRIRLNDTTTTDDFIVYRLPNSATASFTFVSSEHAIAVEPRGKIILLSTGQRWKDEKFVEAFSFESDVQDALLLKAQKVLTAGGEFVIHLLICWVERNEGKTFESSGNFKSCLQWIVLGCVADEGTEKKIWKVIQRSDLFGKAVPKFVKFIPHEGTSHLVICADCRYHSGLDEGLGDTEKQVNQGTVPLYSYIQDETEATIIFRLENDVTKSDVQVTIASKKIQVRIRGETVLDAEPHADMDSASSTWFILDSKLEITISKYQSARWPRLFKDDSRGEEIFDAAYLESVHNRLGHLTSSKQSAAGGSTLMNSEGLEECDEASDEFYMEFFSLTSQSVKRVCLSNLTGHQYLMDISSSEGLHLVLRHDVDGLVWKIGRTDEGLMQAKHIHTLSAFGYVAASKRDKVLSIGCIEASFAALVDSTNNVFIYEVPKPSELKRKPKKHVLNQYVTRLQNATRLLGGGVSNHKLLLLSSDTLFIISLPS